MTYPEEEMRGGGEAVRPAGWNPEGKSPGEIERDIQRTRERMSDDIDAIGEKFSPEHIKERAREAMHNVGETVVEKVRDTADAVGRTTRSAGASLWSSVRENPIPATMIAVGLVWMVTRSGSDDGRRRLTSGDRTRERDTSAGGGRVREYADRASDAAHRAGDRARELMHDAGEKLEHGGERVKEKTVAASRSVKSFVEENPLATAAGMLALGAVAASLIPRSRTEDRVLGPLKEEIAESATEVKEHAREVFSEVVTERAD